MESRVLCSNCNGVDELANRVKCSKCRLVLESRHAIRNAPHVLNVPKQAVFFHSNPNVLDHNVKQQRLRDFETKNVLLIGCGHIKRLPVLQSLLRYRFNRFVLLCSERQWATGYFDHWIQAEHERIESKQETLERVEEFMRQNEIKFDAIFTYDDLCVLMTSYLATYFNLPTIPFEVCQRVKNKYELRRLSCELGISSTKFFQIRADERQAFMNKIKMNEIGDEFKSDTGQNETFGFPVIAKNPLGVSKDLVKRCNTLDELYDCIDESLSICNRMDLLVEEYYDGHELDIELLIQDNQVKFISIWDNVPALEPYCFEQGGICPSVALSKKEHDAIKKLILNWVDRMSFQDACLHFEARCRPSSLYKKPVLDHNQNLIVDQRYFLMPMEVNLRLGGSETWSVIKTVYDVDLIVEHLKISLGVPLDDKTLCDKMKSPRYRCISKDIHPARDNLFVRDIQINLLDLVSDPSAAELVVFRSPGDRLNKRDYVGWMTCKDSIDSESNMFDILQRVSDSVRLSIE